jgi:hypothetical protein
MPRAVLLGALLFVLSTAPLQLSQAASVQRDHYLEALEYIRKGQFSRSRAVEKKLEGYPLKPYLEYHRLNNSLSQTSSDALTHFEKTTQTYR